MKLAEVYKRLIEAKQVGILYHFCGIDRLFKMILNNTIGENHGKYTTVSFTRNKNFDRTSKIFNNESCQIILDGDKISQNFKIKPYHWGSEKLYNPKNLPMSSFEDQMEEQIFKPLYPASKYIIKTVVKEIDLWDYLDEENYKYLEAVSDKIKIPVEDISYNDLSDFLMSSNFKVDIT